MNWMNMVCLPVLVAFLVRRDQDRYKKTRFVIFSRIFSTRVFSHITVRLERDDRQHEVRKRYFPESIPQLVAWKNTSVYKKYVMRYIVCLASNTKLSQGSIHYLEYYDVGIVGERCGVQVDRAGITIIAMQLVLR